MSSDPPHEHEHPPAHAHTHGEGDGTPRWNVGAKGMASSVETAKLPALRLRSVVPGPDGALWGSTDGGQILKITPQ